MSKLDDIWTTYAGPAGLLEGRPDFRLDPVFYGPGMSKVERLQYSPQRHYEKTGRAEGRPGNTFRGMGNVRPPAIDNALASLVTDPDLTEAIAAGDPEALELAFELIRLGDPIDARVSDFSGRAYLRAHPDLMQAQVQPLEHYLVYGYAEGRTTLGALRKKRTRGARPFRPDRPTCLICIHEMSRTGAPVVGRDMAREAAEDHNVIVMSLRGGELLDQFVENACEVVITENPLQDMTYFSDPIFSRIAFAVTNSVETWPMLPYLVAHKIPFASYIHEYSEYYSLFNAIYHAPLFADLIVYSSDTVRDGWRGRLADIDFDVERDSVVVPQRGLAVGGVDAATRSIARARLSEMLGRDLTDARIVCGAGHLQWRKGTDIFAMTAQICRDRDPDTVFVWIGDGLDAQDMLFGVWMTAHLNRIGAGEKGSNLFLLPAGPAYNDVLAASDAMFLSSRLDPLPNVVFDALDKGCRIVQFDGGSGFCDPVYRASDQFATVEYANPLAAAEAILALPAKEPAEGAGPRPPTPLLTRIRDLLFARLTSQRRFVHGASEFDIPVLYTTHRDDAALRVREREKMMRYGRRRMWRDLADVQQAVDGSDNWMHRGMRLLPFAAAEPRGVPPFAMHIHAYYTDELASDLREHCAYGLARRIVVTTDTERKRDDIQAIFAAAGRSVEVRLAPNRGRDILPFMDLFRDGGAGFDDEIWCHLHQKKSIGVTVGGDVWRNFLKRILLGDETKLSNALSQIAQPRVGLVAPMDPYYVSWNATRQLVHRMADRLPDPVPQTPLLFPVGNMFWARRQVVERMNAFFGPGYPWPNEPVGIDGSEYHLIERLWPAMAVQEGLDSVFVHKLDEQRR